MPGIRDVAELAGVSVTTVSRVLNGKGYISKETYEKVFTAIEQLDYIPNQLARNLYHQRSFYVSLILSDSASPFWAEMTRHIEMALHRHGYKMFLCNTSESAGQEREYIRMMRQNMVDGMILGTYMLEPEEYSRLALPIVALDLRIADNIPTVYSDHAKGGMLAAQELIRSGCSCVLNVEAAMTEKSPSVLRHRIVERELAAHGISCITCTWNSTEQLEDYPSLINRMFDAHPEIDSIFSEDLIVVHALKCAQERGLRIPDDFKAVAYDGTFLANACYPALTYVTQPLQKLAQALVQTLMDKIDGKTVPQEQILSDITLVRGKTT